jgi:hypothetical protein
MNSEQEVRKYKENDESKMALSTGPLRKKSGVLGAVRG